MKSMRSRAVMAAAVFLLGGTAVFQWAGCGKKEEKKPLPVVTQAEPDTTPVAPLVAPSPPPTVVRTDEGLYTVQVSSWRSRRNAEADAQRYRREGFEVYIQTVDIPSKGGIWHRVRLGSFATAADAQRQAEALSDMLEAGYWVTRRPQPR